MTFPRTPTWYRRPNSTRPLRVDPLTARRMGLLRCPPPARPEPTPHRIRPGDLTCIHRGDVIDRVPCQSCGDGVTAKVHACAIYTRCTLFRNTINDTARRCATCPDRTPQQFTAEHAEDAERTQKE